MVWAKQNTLAAIGAATTVATGWLAAVSGSIAAMLLTAAGAAACSAYAVRGWLLRRELAAMAQQHALALGRRDERLAYTAHELRTPLTALINALEIIRSGYAATAEEIEGFLEEADMSAQHLSFLMNDVLDIAAIDDGKLRLELADLRIDQIIGAPVRMLGMQAARNSISMQTEGDDRNLAVHADARRLLQILFNLVSNSIKHSEPGQAIAILVRQESNHMLFRVLDEGHGVADSVRPHLFTAFAGDEAHSRADSTGLGLSICRDLVEQMGGAIGYAPRHTGSEFWFTLPLAKEQVIAPSEAVTQ